MALSASPTQAPFDVDRLARALHTEQCQWMCAPTANGVSHFSDFWWHDEAERLAMAYRLDTPKPGLNYIRVSSGWSEAEKREAFGK